MQKKQTILVVASLLVVVLSVTLAYFTAQIIGKGKNVTINSADLKIIFTDSDGSISGSNIEPGKWNVTKTFTIENKSNETYKYNIVIQDLVNTFVTEGYLQYKITSTNSGYNMTEFEDVPKSETATDTILAYSASIDVGVTQSYIIEFKYANDESVDQSDDMGKTLSGTLFITEGTIDPAVYYAGYEKGTIGYQIMSDNPTRLTRTDFSSVFTETNTGTLYKATESIAGNTPKDVYYFAGDAKNNWVKFANFYWRIIRTNYDGSIRLLYAGTSPDTTSGYIGKSAFNTTKNDPMYVGYKYGTTGSLENNRLNTNDSTIKTYVDNWYKNNLIAYTKYLSNEAVYCNDRNLASGHTYSTSATNGFKYASYERLYTNKQPTYNCTDIRDAFSVNNTSAKLDYPIGLMSLDELSYAGGRALTPLDAPYAWYYTNANGKSITSYKDTWSLSSCYWDGSNSFVSDVIGGLGPGGFTYNSGRTSAAVRPALSLKSCTLYSTGNGTAENPYTIKETETGC